MSLGDKEIMGYLCDDIVGRPPSSFGEINAVLNPYDYQPDQLRALPSGSSGTSYYCIDTKDRNYSKNRSRQWQPAGIEEQFRDGDKRMYKRKFRYIEGQNRATKWVIIEHTLYPNTSDKNMKAICAIHEEGSSRH